VTLTNVIEFHIAVSLRLHCRAAIANIRSLSQIRSNYSIPVRPNALRAVELLHMV